MEDETRKPVTWVDLRGWLIPGPLKGMGSQKMNLSYDNKEIKLLVQKCSKHFPQKVVFCLWNSPSNKQTMIAPAKKIEEVP